MTNKKLITLGVTLTIILMTSVACQFFKGTETAEKKNEANIAAVNTSTPEPKKEEKKGIISANDKADFTVTSEEIYKEYSTGKKSIKAPEKYVNKIVAVSGRVAYLEPEAKGSLAPRVTLKGGASAIIDVVTCEFDEENKSEITKLKKDQSVKLQGLSPEMWLMTPTLKHCVIIEAN